MRFRECNTGTWRPTYRLDVCGECDPLREVKRVVLADVVGEFMDARREISGKKEEIESELDRPGRRQS